MNKKISSIRSSFVMRYVTEGIIFHLRNNGRDSCLTPSFSTYQASIYNNVSLIYGIASKTVNVSTGHHTRSVLKIRLNGYPFVVIGASSYSLAS